MKYRFSIALLFAGSAISLFSCGKGQAGVEDAGFESLVTRTVDSMELISSKNGKPGSLMRSPLVEQHALAKDPFDEHRKGIEFIGYDSLGVQSLYVVADYALHWTRRDLWQLEGNVRVEGEEGRKLYTQQLRWDRKIKKIYSNVDCKIEDGKNVLWGRGLEADDDMGWWTLHKMSGVVGVQMESEPVADSVAVSGIELAADSAVAVGGPAPAVDDTAAAAAAAAEPESAAAKTESEPEPVVESGTEPVATPETEPVATPETEPVATPETEPEL